MEDIFKNFKPKSVTYISRSGAGSISVLGSIEMSKGNTTAKNMHVVRENATELALENFYILQCNGDFPKESLWKGKNFSGSGDFICEKVTRGLAQSFKEAISDFKAESFKSHLNPYSYVYGYVLRASGIRLHEMYSFEVAAMM